jgi:type II secretory pathway pseudopilin PulG
MNFYFKIIDFKRKSLAFTLIEMLVTLSIVTLLTVMVIGYSRRSESLLNLMRETDRLIFNLRLVQNNSMLSIKDEEINNNIWGITFEDSNPNFIYRIFGQSLSQCADPAVSSAHVFEFIKPLNNVFLKSTNVNQIIFIPPDPKIIFCDENYYNLDINQAEITFCLANNENVCSTVYITSSGLIYKK